jgi:hypothetical protein
MIINRTMIGGGSLKNINHSDKVLANCIGASLKHLASQAHQGSTTQISVAQRSATRVEA